MARRSATTKLQRAGERQATEALRAFGTDIRRAREDSGVSQARLAMAAGISQPHLADIEAARTVATPATLARVAATLGGSLSLRFYPGTGPAIRDRFQAPMVEALLRQLHPRWRRFAEVPVYRPVRGVIDLVLDDPAADVVAVEVHSQIRRLEEQLRWANAKADALPSADVARAWPTAGRTVSKLLVLRSTRATRELAIAFGATLRSSYPARTDDVYAALMADGAWPGAGVLWASVDGRVVKLLDRPPRGVQLGR